MNESKSLRILALGLAAMLTCAFPQVVVAQAAATAPAPPRTSIDSLIDELGRMPGSIQFTDPEHEGTRFDGDPALLYALAKADTLAVPQLIECLGDVRPSAVTYEGTPLRRGRICHMALSYTNYFSKRVNNTAWMSDFQTIGSLPRGWKATDAELIAARDWWRRYYAAGSPVRR